MTLGTEGSKYVNPKKGEGDFTRAEHQLLWLTFGGGVVSQCNDTSLFPFVLLFK